MASGKIVTVPDAVAGFVASVPKSSWWKAPHEEMAVLLMEASGPVAVHVRSTVNGTKDGLVKCEQAGVLASIEAWTDALVRPLPNANVLGGCSAKQRNTN
jgi:hypothetical protein